MPAKFNNYPHYLDNVLIRITEIKEDKKLIYGYLNCLICSSSCYNEKISFFYNY